MVKQQILRKIRRYLHRHGLTLSYSTSQEVFDEFISKITPIDSGLRMLRIGGDGDGGYFVPDDFSGIKCLISPGVGSTWTFEKHIWSEYDIPSIMVDSSVDRPFGLPTGFTFVNKFLGVVNSETFITLSKLAEISAENYGSGDLMLQMDIEGGEIDIIKHTESSALQQFRIIIIEFHYLEMWEINEYFAQYISPVFGKLLDLFHVVSVTSNRHASTTEFQNKHVPSVLEITFLRKDRFTLKKGGIREFDEWSVKLGFEGKRAFDKIT